MTPDHPRDRIVNAAMDLFWRHGYGATSLSQIREAAGVQGGSLYHFFKSKEQLLEAVLDAYLEQMEAVLIQPIVERHDDPIERIFALLDGYRQLLAGAGTALGCPIGDLALESGAEPAAVGEKIAANFAAWRGWVRRWLEEAGARLPGDLDRDGLATLVLTVMEGGVMQARAHHSLVPFDASVAQLRDYINRLLAEAPPARRRTRMRRAQPRRG
jgi:AcrR family transcriptional regulator